MVINQGDIVWYNAGDPFGSAPGFRRPHVVIQNNLFNQSGLNTTILCTITSNLELAKAPGNVRLQKVEANLPKSSVVNVSQIITVDKRQLMEKIGTLSADRLAEILAGIQLVLEPRDSL